MLIDRFYLAPLLLTAGLTAASAEAPLSAIDWLSESVTTPVSQASAANVPPNPGETPIITEGALPEDVAVSVLGGTSLDGAGLLPPSKTGLPRKLWGLGRNAEIAALITAEQAEALPALQSLLMTVLLAEAEPPADAGSDGALLRVRVDKLLGMGALDQAQALISVAKSADPELFRRAFDVALLTGSEDQACTTMQSNPDLAPTFPARIFCLARSGDWNAAALTLRTAQALGYVTPAEDQLLSRFLDPDLYEGEDAPLQPDVITPLVWRMFDAIGEPLPTAPLPLAFAHAELGETSGWKPQLEAAERLVRAGAVTPNVLLGLYTARMPSASGGVWDRVDAFQRFDAALQKGDVALVSATLPNVWAHMAEAELEVPFATLFANRLGKLPLEGEAKRVAFDIGLLSPDYEAVALKFAAVTPREMFLAGLARGKVDGLVPPDSLARAVAPAFLTTTLTPEFAALLDQDRLGEAILIAIDRVGRGVQGDLRSVTEGLALLRHIGLEDTARRTALELMLLERRG